MPRCTRKGCNAEYSEGSSDKCIHHPGAPVFHEGLKSWSCCSDVNKPVLSFDEFMQIPGCTEIDGHVTEAPKPQEPKPSSSATFSVKAGDSSGKEVYTSSSGQVGTLSQANPEAIRLPPVVEEEDDLSVPVEPGTICRRKGCGVKYVNDEENRQGDGPGTVCTYHPSPPIFREGSKGYLCCKRRVLEFEEFLKIKGCKTGRHVFAPRTTAAPAAEELVECRIDHYQTVDKVIVSVFAKQTDKERSVIKFNSPEQISLDIYLPGSKRFSRVLNLFGPIVPEQCTYRFSNAKVELQLEKQDKRAWVLLEKTNRDLSGISYTFGVGGRTGTVGGKDLHLDETNKTRPS